MLGRLILLLLQLVVCWFAGPAIMAELPNLGGLNIFVYAAVFAVVSWLIGLLAAVVMKDVARPSTGTLTFALIGGLIGAGLTLVPDITRAIDGVIRSVPTTAYPLIGAVIGYTVKR